MYTGQLFRLSWEYACALQQNESASIYILSAQYHLLAPWETIRPYDLALTNLSADQRKAWGIYTASCLANEEPLYRRPRLIALAGRPYVDALQHGLDQRLGERAPQIEAPMEGLGIGQRLAWLNAQLTSLPHPDEEKLPF